MGARLALPQRLSLPGRRRRDPEKFFLDYNRRIVAASDEFYSYTAADGFPAGDARGAGFLARAKCPIPSLEAKVKGTFGRISALYFAGEDAVSGKQSGECALVSGAGTARHCSAAALEFRRDCLRQPVPGDEHAGHCRLAADHAVSRYSHAGRDHARADYAVSANIGRTLDAVRQGVIDIRCCLDWLEQQGYSQLGVVGTSLGSCYAFIAAAHDPRIRVAAFNHASTYFADVVWHGQSTRHIRQGIEQQIDLEQLRHVWRGDQSDVVFRAVRTLAGKSLIVYAKYDLTFLPEFSRDVVAEFERHGLDHKVVVLPCGHYTTARLRTNTWMAGIWLRSCGQRFERQSTTKVAKVHEGMPSLRLPSCDFVSFVVIRQFRINKRSLRDTVVTAPG